jgi:hypothetical protein
MEQFVGLNVSQETTHLRVVDSKGDTIRQGKCASTPDAIANVIKARAPKVTKIGLESGALSTSLARTQGLRNCVKHIRRPEHLLRMPCCGELVSTTERTLKPERADRR